MLGFWAIFLRFSVYFEIRYIVFVSIRMGYPDETDPVRKSVFVRRVESLIIIISSWDADVHISSIYLLCGFFSSFLLICGQIFSRRQKCGMWVCVCVWCACAKNGKSFVVYGQTSKTCSSSVASESARQKGVDRKSETSHIVCNWVEFGSQNIKIPKWVPFDLFAKCVLLLLGFFFSFTPSLNVHYYYS